MQHCCAVLWFTHCLVGGAGGVGVVGRGPEAVRMESSLAVTLLRLSSR